MNNVRILSRLSAEQIRVLAEAFGVDAKVVHGQFVVNTGYKGEAAILAGGCRGDALTDRPEGCEAIAATVIVIPHVGVRLPPGTSLNAFMENSHSFFAGPDVEAALRGDGQ